MDWCLLAGVPSPIPVYRLAQALRERVEVGQHALALTALPPDPWEGHAVTRTPLDLVLDADTPILCRCGAVAILAEGLAWEDDTGAHTQRVAWCQGCFLHQYGEAEVTRKPTPEPVMAGTLSGWHIVDDWYMRGGQTQEGTSEVTSASDTVAAR